MQLTLQRDGKPFFINPYRIEVMGPNGIGGTSIYLCDRGVDDGFNVTEPFDDVVAMWEAATERTSK